MLSLEALLAAEEQVIADAISKVGFWHPKTQLVLQAKLAMPQNPSKATNLAPRQSYSQVVQTHKTTRDPEKQARDRGKESPDLSRDLPVPPTSRDQSRGHT